MSAAEQDKRHSGRDGQRTRYDQHLAQIRHQLNRSIKPVESSLSHFGQGRMLESRSMHHPRLSRVLIVVAASSLLLSAQKAAPAEVEITAEPNHHLLLQNQYVRVFKLEVPPHVTTLQHPHRHDYIAVTLGLSQVENDVAGKPPATLTLQDGETRFVPGGFTHFGKNLSDQPYRTLIIELMQDKKARQKAPWDEDRGLHILHGGTEDILFVKDGVRASELQLQPGGILPKHRHTGPHLIVAVTALDLRSDVGGKAPAQIQLEAGDVSWVKAGMTDTLTNAGTQNAKLITLEFP
jgi:quercetin dioxygenase-like cupin family protein